MARIKDLFFLDAKGLRIPDLETVFDFFVQEYKGIYGTDVVLTPDTQDGQWIAIQAQAAHDLMDVCALVYNSFSPSTALTDGLDRNVRINGIRRKEATFSQCDVTLTGAAGTKLINCSVKDTLNRVWYLPTEVVIPVEGHIIATVTAEKSGEWTALPHTLTIINTPTRGWYSVDNENEASAGAPIESDATLRRRQGLSVALPSQSILEAITGALALLDGVTRLRAYENDRSEPDANGITGHSNCFVVEGGDAQQIAETIFNHKTAGSGTFGDTEINVTDRYGLLIPIRFQRPSYKKIKAKITIRPLAGYLADYAEQIKWRVVEYINGLEIGETVYIARLIPVVLACNASETKTFDIVSVELATDESEVYSMANIPLTFEQAAMTSLDAIKVAQEW